MKHKLIYFLLSIVLFASCDYLDYNEKNYLLEEDIYSDLGMTKAALTNIYRYLPSGFTQVGNAMLSSACDESVFANDASEIHKYNNGAWSSIQSLDAKWEHYYTGIRAANEFLEEVEKYSYEDHLYDIDPTFDDLMVTLSYYKAEARALRALYFFELTKRYGDIPIITEILTAEEANKLTRIPFDDVIEFIASECDSAAAYLPLSFDNTRDKETGRITKGAALTIKAKAILYAASPLHNPSNDLEKWEAAAKANHDIIDLGKYRLNSNYITIFNNYASNNRELILERRASTSNNFERINFPIGYAGGFSGNCPTQNLVDAYEMKSSGLGINEAGSGYNPQDPYTDRDQRLIMSVLYNGVKFKGREIEVFEGGLDGAPKRYASPTGYYLRKYVDESIALQEPNVTSKEHTWVIFRYGEVLLNYAEAMNEAFGGPEVAESFSLTAKDAVDIVRRRSRMPVFPDGMSQDDFRTKLRNERRVELAFEDQRFWDIRRWKIGSETNNIKGVEVSFSDTILVFNYKTIITRQYEEKMNLYPIPFDETMLNPLLGQNTGW